MYSTKTKIYNIPLSDIKEDLRIAPSDTTYDNQLNRLVKSAIHIAESYTGFDLVPTITHLYDYDFAGDTYFINQPLANVTGVTDGVNQITGYTIMYKHFGTTIQFNKSIDVKQLKISYTTGGVLPPDVQRAISIKVAELFDVDVNGYTQGLQATQAFERLLSTHRNYIYN